MATYDRRQLVEEAQKAGFEFNDRLLVDWADRGLLDRPPRPGQGRGKGRSPAVWPEEQLQLLLLLLRKRRTVPRTGTLANIPVAVWLYWGDRHVPTRQVQRAMATWAEQHRKARSWNAAEQAARSILDDFTRPGTSRRDRRRAFEVLRALSGGDTYDRQKLLDALRPLVTPKAEAAPANPAAVDLPEAYLTLVEARLLAIHQIDKFTEKEYRAARATHHANLAAYLRAQPSLALDPQFGHLFDQPDLEQLVNRACLDLLTHLGLNHQRENVSTGNHQNPLK